MEGLDGLVRAFGRLDKGLRRELQKELKEIGRIVAEEAKGIAEFKRLRGEDDPGDPHPGQLIARIQPSVRGASVYIRDTAASSSGRYPKYNYPARLEYEQGGRRAFLRPALDGRRNEIVNRFEHLLDWIADEWGAA